jgi:pimeloyl-ACP methyl ester carboxylesterase
MHFQIRGRRWAVRPAACLIVVLVGLLSVAVSFGAGVTLRDGMVLRGTLEPLEGGLFRLDDGLRRITFGNKRVTHTDPNDTAPAFKAFRLSQPLAGRNPNERIDNLLAIMEITPFDEFGRRTFSVRDTRGRLDILQGITEINPDFVRVQALKHMWESFIATNAIPQAEIETILRRVTNPNNVDDRLRLARFFLAMEWFVAAGNELKVIEEEFPEVADQVREASGILEQLKARRRLDEIKVRRNAGQHGLAYQLVRDFPADGAAADVLGEVRDLLRLYETAIDGMQQVQRELEKLLDEVQDADLKAKLAPPVREVSEWLHVENLGQLEAFLSSVASDEVAPEHRLALAISGWLAGNAFAEANADRALRLWDGRDKILQYLREPSEGRRQRLLGELKSQETLSVELAARIIEHLPPIVPTDGLEEGKPNHITIQAGERSIEYWVLLPPEYNPFHRYPVIVTLHGGPHTPEQQIGWWSSAPAFQASRHGYIVLAPKYVEDARKGYRYDAASHDAVVFSLIDLRRRFAVDSDRVFQTGHSLGADAAWDIGLAHPDLFAGVIPICGSPKFYCKHYWHNAEHLGFYVVEGDKDGKNPEGNLEVLDRMLKRGDDALYVEFKGRGHESFSDEMPRLFDWMGRRTRHKFPLKFSCRAARPFDNQFHWISVEEYVPGVLIDPQLFEPDKIKPATIEGRITQSANAIQLTLRGPKSTHLWISPGMVDLGQPVTVTANGRRDKKTIALDLGVLLEDFRVRADRQKLFYAKMSFARL